MRPLCRFALIVGISAAALAQTPARLDFDAIPRPPVPSDRLELVTGDAQPVQNAQQRIAAIELLDKARALSNVRAYPYHLRTSFTASDGAWTLEDIAAGRRYRWTAQGPNYSGVNIYPNGAAGALYGNQPAGALPLRLIQARAAMFFQHPFIGPQASVRTAPGSLDGVEQRCVLVAPGAGDRAFKGPRNWEEAEYCVDAQTGLLTTYSPAPGLFVHYEYAPAIRFHDRLIPSGFSIWQAGQKVLDAKTVGAADPPASVDTLFNLAGLTPLGAGRAMNPGLNHPMIMPVPGRPFPVSMGNAAIQVVTLHGNLSGDGRLSEVEILASTDPALNEAAVERAGEIARRRAPSQPGATAQSSEFLLTFEFVTAIR